MRACLLALLMAVGIPASAFAASGVPTCSRDVANTRTHLIRTVVRLEGVKSSKRTDQCTAYRQYAEVVTKAREVFHRCNNRQELDKDVSTMDAAMNDLQAAIAQSCADPN